MTSTQSSSDHQLASRVLDEIEVKRLTPRPRYAFVLENWFFWSVGALAVVFGALAAAATFFEVANAGWAFYLATHQDFLTFFLQVAPFLWVLALAAFVAIGYANIRHTRRGYRYPLWLIVLGAVLTSIALGGGLFAAGFGEEIDEALGDHPPLFRPILAQEHALWTNPAEGVLGGTVLSIAPGGDSFVLKDWSGNPWTIDTSDLRASDLAALARGGAVRVVGLPTQATSTFHACFLFSWNTVGGSSPPPPPFASTSERKLPQERSQECKGIRPYASLYVLSGE